MASNIKNFKCLIHFNETQRGSILSEYLTYSKLHEMVMQKFNLEANAVIKLSFKLSSFDSVVDITDDAEVQFFVECACNSDDEFAHLFVSERKNNQKNMFFNFFKSTTLENEGPSNQEIPSSFLNNGISFDLGQNDFHSNDSLHLQNEPHFSNPESSFDFRSNEYNTDDVVTENPQDKIYKWQKFMSFEPDIPETPVYKAKQNISNQYSQQSEVEKGKIFDNKESLIMAVRLKALSEGEETKHMMDITITFRIDNVEVALGSGHTSDSHSAHRVENRVVDISSRWNGQVGRYNVGESGVNCGGFGNGDVSMCVEILEVMRLEEVTGLVGDLKKVLDRCVAHIECTMWADGWGAVSMREGKG
ncbi:hypothetical protein Tco_1204944 [Tanacetum coccineum]